MEKIIDDIYAVGLSLYFDSALIISDIHMGYEEALNMQGILVPRMQYEEIIKNLEKILSEIDKPVRILINGDLKHEFGKISETEWRHTLRLLDFLSGKCKDVVIIKGNHDTIIGPIAKKRNVKIKEYEVIGDKMILHGDKIPNGFEKALRINKIKTIIIGHEHPAISLREGPRMEKYKCFLLGKWKKYNLIVMPSFTPVVEGTDVLSEKLLSPFLKQRIDDFEVIVFGDKLYKFGKLKKLR